MVTSQPKLLGVRCGRTALKRVVVGASGVIGVGLLYSKTRSMPQKATQVHYHERRVDAENSMNRVFSDLVCGALGYLTQMVALYPVDTLKIKCQAESINFAEGLRRLIVSGNLGALFAGVGTAATSACIVGAVYYCAYTWGKRLALQMFKAFNGQEKSVPGFGVELFGSLWSWAITSLVDAPIEMLRHQTQAGVLKDGMLNGMVALLRRGRVMSLYCCLVPYLIKSLPFDVAELVTHGQLNALRNSSKFDLHFIPNQAWDLLIGGAAGAAAVISSMPLDCIKTRMEVEAVSSGAQKGFIACGFGMVRNEGIASLWRGIIPRLILYVPGVAIYWLAIDTFQRAIGV